jgi:hypothetical protein
MLNLSNVCFDFLQADQGAMLAVYEGFCNLRQVYALPRFFLCAWLPNENLIQLFSSYEFVGCKVLHEEAAHRVCCPCREQWR